MQIIAEWFNNFIALMSTFRFNDLIDILLISLLIYSVLKLIRDTRAEQLLKGLLFIFVIYVFAMILDLMMVTTIIKVVFESAVVLIVIVFQPEIRKALEQLGRSKFAKTYKMIFQGGLLSDAEREDIYKSIVDVADSATLFSHTKTGALFVFERETHLTDIAATGTELNAQTSTAIFGNLFFNKAPLHDGACIIRQGKVYAAGCILPLNSNEIRYTGVGTRHRAALGVSEVSDAVVVVVSEETGIISMAVDGVLKRNLEREQLISDLQKLLIPEEPDKPADRLKRVAKRRSKKDEK